MRYVRRFHVVLGAPPVDSPQKAVQVAIVREFEKETN